MPAGGPKGHGTLRMTAFTHHASRITFHAMTDWPIVGHTRTVAMLRRGLRQGRVAHALLLAGPPEVGKSTLARAYAQALNCLGDPGALDEAQRVPAPPAGGFRDVPCGRCRN